MGAGTAAHANAGIGFFTPASFLLVLGVVPVILVEAPVLWWRLKVRLPRALYLSLCANLVSTLLGAIVGFVLDMAVGMATGMMGSAGLEGFLLALALMFGITWWLESLVVRRMQADVVPDPAVGATLLANLLSYALLAACAVAFVPRDSMTQRARMTEVISVLGVTKTDVAEHFEAHGRFPAKVLESPTAHVRRVTAEESGRISAVIASPRDRELDGKRVVYEPEVRDGKIVAWHCYVPEAPLKYFPAACRFRAAPGGK